MLSILKRTKIDVAGPVIELGGDEAAAVMWNWVKEKIFFPYLNFSDLSYFDLSLPARDTTEDTIVIEAAEALKDSNVIAIKCPTISMTHGRYEEFGTTHREDVITILIAQFIDITQFTQPIAVDFIPGFKFTNYQTDLAIVEYVVDQQIKCIEPAHKTFEKEFTKYENNERLFCNPISTIFTWTRALLFRAEFDNNRELKAFCKMIEETVMSVLHANVLPYNLAVCKKPGLHLLEAIDYVSTEDFIDRIKSEIEMKIFRHEMKSVG